MRFSPRSWAVIAKLANLTGAAAYLGWGIFHGTAVQYWLALLGGIAFWGAGIVVGLDLDEGGSIGIRPGDEVKGWKRSGRPRSKWNLVGAFTVGTFGVVGGLYLLIASR